MSHRVEMSTNSLTSCQEQAVSGMPMPANVEEETVARVPTYVVELSKSGRAMCKKCDEKILNKELRVGVIVEGDWGLFTKWQHLDCTVFHKSITDAATLDGYQELSTDHRQIVAARVAKSLDEIDEDDIPINPDDLVRKAWDTPKEPPAHLLMPLLPYQKEGLGWMSNQEKNSVHGGILADEMGMGKTIQAISLILDNRPHLRDKAQKEEWDESDKRHGLDPTKAVRANTLIVLPTVALRQWQMEIARFTEEGSLTVKVYHGSNRSTTIQDIKAADVVLTSYQTLETEYRKATAGTKVVCRICGRKFYAEKLRLHRKYFCGVGAQLTAAQAKTQRKRQRVQAHSHNQRRDSDNSGSDGNDDEDDGDDDSDGDDRGGVRTTSQNKKRAKKVTEDHLKKPSSVRRRGAKAIADEESEDEIDRQKKVIKAMRDKKETKNGKSTTVGSKRRSLEKAKRGAKSIADEESEDEIDRQKKVIKAMRDKEKGRPASNQKKTGISRGSNRRVEPAKDGDDEKAEIIERDAKKAVGRRGSAKSVINTAAASGRKTKKRKADDDDDDDDSDYENEGEVDDDEEDESGLLTSESDSDFVEAPKSKRIAAAAAKKKEPMSLKKGKSVAKGARGGKEDKEREIGKGKGKDKKIAGAAGRKRGAVGKKKGEEEKKNKKNKKSKKKVNDSSSGDSEFSDDATDSSEDEAEKSENSEVERDIAKAVRDSAKQKKSQSILHMVSWFRVILDEAHMIKDRSTSTAKAVFNLVSLNKWCLTGTPLQNRVGELYSLVRFLRVDPHAFYFCKMKNCGCKSLHYRFTKGKCDDCGHSSMHHFCHFNKHILNPIGRSGYVGEGRKAMLKLKTQILDEILLRRTKTTRANDIQLPTRIVRVRRERLDEKEEDFYQALYTQSQAQFNTYVNQGTILNNYAHIFDILIRLRQAVDHPYLVIHSDSRSLEDFNESSQPTNTGKVGVPVVSVDDALCSLCHDPPEEPARSDCGHVFCRVCLLEYLETVSSGHAAALQQLHDAVLAGEQGDMTVDNTQSERRAPLRDSKSQKKNSRAAGVSGDSNVVCPECSKPLTIDFSSTAAAAAAQSHQTKSSTAPSYFASSSSAWNDPMAAGGKRRKKTILDKLDLSHFQSSTKMEALMQELHLMEEKDLGAKAIVFSQFVNMLELLEYRLLSGGIKCAKLLGSMNVDQRESVIKSFKEDPEVKVLLISLKAGGVALNLTVASHIFIIDPWWNPAAEMQAIDRTHRLGQHRPIFATRFIIEGTIEERILKLQEKKRLVFDGTVGGDAGSIARLTVDDMRFLFQ